MEEKVGGRHERTGGLSVTFNLLFAGWGLLGVHLSIARVEQKGEKTAGRYVRERGRVSPP